MNTPSFEDSQTAKELLEKIKELASAMGEVKIMEVCGTHTMEIGRTGLRSVLPKNIHLLSGPGCPVCVTPASYIDAAAKLALKNNISILTFGDMVRVPGNISSLEESRRKGADIQVLTSPLQAIDIAKNNSEREHVFLAVGFETTIPSCALAIKKCYKENIKNLSFMISHRTVPPALKVLISDPALKLAAFMLPGHVSAILGLEAYNILKENKIPGVITGFKLVEMLFGIYETLKMIKEEKPDIFNAYPAVVKDKGNLKAIQIIDEIYEPCDAYWRGIGNIPESGLKVRDSYLDLDAQIKYDITLEDDEKNLSGCLCGQVLSGRIIPPKCPSFGKSCTPEYPKGPCMVSSEGSCAAYYKYGT